MKILTLPNLNPGKAHLEAALRAWAEKEMDDWDALVAGQSANALPGGADLWENMPVLDSKAVARSSPIFQEYLGKPLDVKFIRPGGYSGVDPIGAMIADLVPKMLEAA